MSPGQDGPLIEAIRGTLGVLILGGFFGTVYLAARRFVGKRGKTRTRGAVIFAGANALLITFLLLLRSPLEVLITAAVSPIQNQIQLADPTWPERAAVGLFRTVIVTLVLVLVIQAIGRFYWSVEGRLLRWHAARTGVGVHLVVFVTGMLRVLRYLSVLAAVFVCLPIILGSFPRTRVFVDAIAAFFATPARELGAAILEYVPNLGYLIVILIAAFYSLRAIKYFFNSLENGTLVVRGFVPEWANPTYRLVRTLFLLFVLMVTYPYLPGSKSQFFQGFSVFVGALITFGSTATIGNMVSGTVLTYTRAFRIGDMVRIGDNTGVVIEKTLLVTRLVTPKNEEVSVPNGSVLSSSILNYSARAQDGLALALKAGIGYDVDWRKVRELMLEGARATEGVLAAPAPQVLQAELGDYAVTYELRVFTNEPAVMFRTLSELRANVLDSFNRAGVEIMTPSILAHRDASQLAVPPDQFHDRPKPAGIAVEVRTEGSIAARA